MKPEKIIKALLLIIFCAVLGSCSSIPKIKPFDALQEKNIQNQCPGFIPGFFPEKPRQFVHSIQASMPGGKKAFMMGITRIFPGKRTIHCIMMTIEGLVLFDAVFDKEIKINRGVSPFDSLNFAKGLMDDIRFIFFKPAMFLKAGVLENSAGVCRYKDGLDRIVDIIGSAALCGGNLHDGNIKSSEPPHRAALAYTMHQYKKNKLARTLKAYYNNPQNRNFPDELELTAHKFPGYSLKLNLVESTRIDQPEKSE